ncbi:MAG: hypothetical protein L3J51_02875 [Cocleimonas sp.]|nr:hypothetical protein [Cocleimonas sp.]
MNIKDTLSAMTVVIVFANANIASADNAIAYPPENTLRTYQFPPQAPIAPRLNNMPASSAPYVFGQNNFQSRQPQIIQAPRQMQNYGRVPTQPQMMINRNLPSYTPRNFGNNSFATNLSNNNYPFSNNNMVPLGNMGNSSFNPFSNSNIPFSNGSNGMMPSNPMNNMFGKNGNNNNQNWNMPFFNSNNKNRKKAWGDKRNIWPDFYTDFTDEAWDTMMSGPRDLGRMPGGWRFPYISMPDPVTVSDAITNQFPPIAEEAGNMADFSDWGIFDNK